MSSNIQPGDVVVCVDASPRGAACRTRLEVGRHYRVTKVIVDPQEGAGVLLREMSPSRPYEAFAGDRFRKIRPADHEFVEQIKRVKVDA